MHKISIYADIGLGKEVILMHDGKGNYLSDTVIFNHLGISATPYTSKRKTLYNTNDGKRLIIRNRSDSNANYFWYNISESLFDDAIDECICVTGASGFYKIPFGIIQEAALANSMSFEQKGRSYKLILEKFGGVMCIRTLAGTGDPIPVARYYYPCDDGLIVTDVTEDVDSLCEGAVKRTYVNAYERNSDARKRCIAHYGAVCQVCGFDFWKAYGDNFAGIVEVHHIIPISTIQKTYVVDPVRDLIPVCPNCHTALHKQKLDGTLYSVVELRELHAAQKSS